MSCVVFTGGGTGGHIFPGIAVADVFKAETNVPVLWIGSKNKSDRTYVETAGIPFYAIPSGKLRRYVSIQNILDVFKVLAGCCAALVLLLRLKPTFVFSKGGFVSVPSCFAAWCLRIPVITHECDISPGLATKINARFAKKIITSYETTASYFPARIQGKIQCMGNPVRLAFYTANAEQGKKHIGYKGSKPILFVQGGSLGAQQINTLIEHSILFLTDHFFVVHQTGAQNLQDGERIAALLQKEAPAHAEHYRFFPFIAEDMPHVLACAALVVSRAGANSLWESAAAGKPLILLPLTKAGSRGDQGENAAFFSSKGAALVLDSLSVNADSFCALLTQLLEHPEQMAAMAKQAALLAENKPALSIARLLRNFV